MAACGAYADAPPRKPRRTLDTVSREGLGDLVDEGSEGRKLIKSRDFSIDLRSVECSPSDIQVVLYDVHSQDSFAACWVARAALGNGPCYEGVTRSDYIGALSVEVTGKVVAMVGLCWSFEEIHALTWECDKLLVLDTCTSSARQLAPFSLNYRSAVLIFDPDIGAAAMAWNFFFPGEHVPALLRAIEDAELGRHAFKNGKAFEDGMEAIFDFARPRGPVLPGHESFQEFDKLLKIRPGLQTQGCSDLAQDGSGGREAISLAIKEGILMQGEIIAQSEEVLKQQCVRSLPDFPAWRCALAHLASPFEGRVAERLALGLAQECEGEGSASRCFGAIFEVCGQQVRVVLRSQLGGPDVSQIAELYGGGGHPTRAFFMASVDDWEGLWAFPEPLLWDVPATSSCGLSWRKGEMVTIARRGERFQASPFDEWSWGYKNDDPSQEGWMPTLAHTLFVATRSEPAKGPGVLAVKEGDLIVGLGQKGYFIWGSAVGPLGTESGRKGWFPYSDDILRPVHPNSVRSLLRLDV
ncbi:unnamed protein product [Polarella glacialis]|uniref:Uncharacterized protein n=1 Tax=Polarella glacialis TaxID=89957 RepID=A0A813DQK2_POLGL|nr:unnamed protein product [Polarella glacialis]CAE8719490.1 unnamed protein product [Polarella glacialis]